jgi:V/A-type H+-transporting ATPase subunit I
MRQMIAVILDRDRDAATRAFLKSGAVDFIDVQEIPAEWTRQLGQWEEPQERRRVRELRGTLDSLLRTSGSTPFAHSLVDEQIELDEMDLNGAEEFIEEFGEQIRRVREQQRKVQGELNRLRELRRQIGASEGPDASLTAGSHSYIRVRTGAVPEEQRSAFRHALADYAALYLSASEEGEGGPELLVYLRRDAEAIEALLERYRWEDRSAPSASAGEGASAAMPREEADRRINELEGRQSELQGSLQKEVRSRERELTRVRTYLRVHELSGTIESFYRSTERTYLCSGWLPQEKCADVEQRLMEATEGRAYLEWHDPLDSEDPEVAAQVPVRMKNPKLLRPFQALVENYAIPAYGTLDPTPIVALFYLAMFGLMFADVGHGAVVLGAGLVGSRIMRRRGRDTMLFPLITWCGAAAILTGLLFGSYFGMGWLPPLWFDYHGIVAGHEGSGNVRSLTDILVITIYFGITVIAVGLLLNWINRLRRREWFALIWGSGGLIVGWIYAAGTYSAFYFVGHDYRQLPPEPQLLLLLALPVLLLGAKPLLERLHRRREGAEVSFSPVDMIMEWIVEILEIFSGYLSNTLSFMRVAGLGIAHVSLMIAFFQIAEMAAGPEGGFTLWSYLVLAAGNLLVIGLEGLSAGIQSLRLNYYEFFSKYFSGTGKAYAPISLKS